MKIKIKKRGEEVAVLISFNIHSEKFESNYERNRFFRGLYGWKQVIKRGSTTYKYRRCGILDEIPHIKVDNSVFIVALNQMEKILNYLKEWEDKIDYEFFKVILDENKCKELKGKEIRVR